MDNSTYWTPDFTVQHYRDMLFAPGGGSYGKPSLRDFYQELSSGRFSWDGQVSNWTTLAGTQADYGANKAADGDDSANGPVSRVVKATLDGLTASGNYGGIDITKADKTDRYDCDGDGNFNEPDGYIDHFGMVHAGEGEDADGGPNAIWSHRSYANPNDDEGPTGCHKGGYQLGSTGLWVGDYTIEAENGGMGVFAHEFGHDLGLPDYYDTSYGSENSTGFWSLMSSGSWGSFAEDPYIGTSPMHMDAYAKQYLGWLDLDAGERRRQAHVQARPGRARHEGRLPGAGGQPARPTSARRSRSRRTGPTRTTCTPTRATASTTRPSARWTRRCRPTRPSRCGRTGTSRTDWDYAYLDAKVGETWKHVGDLGLVAPTSPNGQNFGQGITGTSDGWQTVTGTLPAGTSAYRLRYWTDGAAGGEGLAVGSVTFGSTTDTMGDATKFELGGWRKVTGGQFTDTFHHWYLAEYRSPVLQDRSLCGAYQFTTASWVEKHCYAKGLARLVPQRGRA